MIYICYEANRTDFSYFKRRNDNHNLYIMRSNMISICPPDNLLSSMSDGTIVNHLERVQWRGVIYDNILVFDRSAMMPECSRIFKAISKCIDHCRTNIIYVHSNEQFHIYQHMLSQSLMCDVDNVDLNAVINYFTLLQHYNNECVEFCVDVHNTIQSLNCDYDVCELKKLSDAEQYLKECGE